MLGQVYVGQFWGGSEMCFLKYPMGMHEMVAASCQLLTCRLQLSDVGLPSEDAPAGKMPPSLRYPIQLQKPIILREAVTDFNVPASEASSAAFCIIVEHPINILYHFHNALEPCMQD